MGQQVGLYGLIDTAQVATADATGKAVANFGAPPSAHWWQLTFCSVFVTAASTNGPALIYLDDDSMPANYRGGTAKGIGDVNDNMRLLVPPARTLLIVWKGLTAGVQAQAVIQGLDLQIAIPTTDTTIAAQAAWMAG